MVRTHQKYMGLLPLHLPSSFHSYYTHVLQSATKWGVVLLYSMFTESLPQGAALELFQVAGTSAHVYTWCTRLAPMQRDHAHGPRPCRETTPMDHTHAGRPLPILAIGPSLEP